VYFKQILDDHNGCASYVIASRNSRDAAIVDPSADLAPYAALLAERGFHLRYVIDTHIHADHISLARALAATHDVEVCLHEAAAVTYPHRALSDGEEVPLGRLRLRFWHTPGHRPELTSILVVDPERGPEPAMVLTGDSLLAGDVGRPDFGGGDAEAQFESIGRLLRLPDWVAVFPGHFEGPCGKSMSGQPSTTIGYERLYNRLLRLRREAFVEALTSGVPPRPLNMWAIEATNRGQADANWAMLTTAPQVPQVEVEALAERAPEAVVLDVREPEEYEAGHVPGAISLPQAELASRLAEIPHEVPLFVICRTGGRSLRVTQFLRTCGMQQATNVRGGTEAWRAQGKSLVVGPQADGNLQTGALVSTTSPRQPRVRGRKQ
jgi:glyoxylase-like metal-dependent hydrolase (beta-lactamase superfamily II)/rhodanese-related sulfurtransferase